MFAYIVYYFRTIYVYILCFLYILHAMHFNLQRRSVSRYVNSFVFYAILNLNLRVEDMLSISAWEFSSYFAGGVWVCIFLLPHTFYLRIISGALHPGL